MDRLRVDYSRIVRLDVSRLKRQLPSKGPPRSALGTIERPLITTAIGAAARVSSTGKLLKEVVDIAEAGRGILVSFTGRSGPMLAAPPSTSVITVGVGASSSAFMVVGVSFGYGLYGSNSPELGAYTSAGGGIWTNAGISGGFQLTYVFGPPSAFGGLSWSVGVSCDMPGIGAGISGALLFGASGPPYQFLGYCVGVGAGISVLPADISFQVSNTDLVPLVR
ncbi:MAG: hypothetical protein IH602_08320 [Bryobacteraceae bacterium]|nr:hypothetical protein [Bryobacteraceae bacterium]